MPNTLRSFLDGYTAFGGWSDVWEGVPLEFQVYLADALPPREFVASVRAIVLHGDEVLLIHNPGLPILVVGGRCEPGETIHETLVREVAEETGWIVEPLGILGFIHVRHLDDQRPAWGRPAPDFIDPIFAVRALTFDECLMGPDEHRCEFVPIVDVERHGIEMINQTFLEAALRLVASAQRIANE